MCEDATFLFVVVVAFSDFLSEENEADDENEVVAFVVIEVFAELLNDDDDDDEDVLVSCFGAFETVDGVGVGEG